MKLVIFPGAGSPSNPLYASVYRFLERSALEHGYESVDSSLRWPGHEHQGVLSLGGALEVAGAKVKELENASKQYDCLARSFGCYVVLKAALDLKPKLLRKVILWGPPPYWLVWEMFVRDIEKNRQVADQKGTAVDASLFPPLVPIESMLQDMPYETVVVTGDRDPYVPPAYLGYLASIVNNSRSILFKPAVIGAVHEISEDTPAPVKEAYLKALFE